MIRARIRYGSTAAGIILTLLCPSWAQEKAPDEQAERANLRGLWQLVFAESEGKLAPAERIRNIRVEIKEKTHSVFLGDQELAHQIPFAINVQTDPKTTDDTLNDGPDMGKQIHGIYRLSGDTLVSCVAKPGAERPKDFAAGTGSGHTLRVFMRIRPDDAPLAKAVREEIMRFNGAWRFEEMTSGGEKTPAEMLTKHGLILQGDQFISRVGGVNLRGHYVINPSSTPKTIDVVFDEGSSRGEMYRGIYELTDDTYKVCFDLKSHERPKTFESRPGTGQVVEVLRRVKSEGN